MGSLEVCSMAYLSLFSDIYVLFSPLFIIGSIYLLMLWIALLCKLNSLSHKTRSIYIFNRNTNILCFTACLFCSIIDIIHLTFAMMAGDSSLLEKYNAIKAAADVCYYTASFSLSITLFGRVYYTFRETVFALTKCTIFIILLLIFISAALDTAYIALTCILEQNVADFYSRPLFLAVIGNDFVTSLSLLYLFVYKLKELIVNINMVENGNIIHSASAHNEYIFKEYEQNETMSETVNAEDLTDEYYERSMSSPESPKSKSVVSKMSIASSQTLLSHITAVTLRNIHFDEHQLNLIVVITRHTILSVFAIVFNQIFYVIGFLSLNEQWENSKLLGVVVYASRLVGMCGFVSALYLSMKFSKRIYFKICAYCHLGCYKCCIGCTKSSIRKSVM